VDICGQQEWHVQSQIHRRRGSQQSNRLRRLASFNTATSQSQYKQCDPLRHMITPSIQFST
jgi:hypothetical protein